MILVRTGPNIRRILLLLLVATAPAALVPSPARAGEAEDRKRAREVYERGLRLYKTGEFAQAAEQFKEAYLIRPDATFLFNMGQAYRQSGDTQRALLAYRNYLKERPDAPNRKDVEQFIAELEKPSPQPAAPSRDTPQPREPSGNAPSGVQPLPLADYPAYPPPPPGSLGPSGSRTTPFSFMASVGAGYRYAYGASIPGAEIGLRLGTKTERAALYGSVRIFAGQAIPGVTAVVFSPGFVGQGRIGRVYLGGGVHLGLVSMQGPVGTKGALFDTNLGATIDVDVAVARFGKSELLVGVSGGADFLVGGALLGSETSTPVMATTVARVGFGM